MARLVTLLEQHMEKQPPTVAIQATTRMETGLALVKLQECGLGVHLPVKVCCITCSLIRTFTCFRKKNLYKQDKCMACLLVQITPQFSLIASSIV